MNDQDVLRNNAENYKEFYGKDQHFLRYPADWLVRFHNMYMKKNLPSGRVLDYGCGSGNNSCFFFEKGYETYGCDVSEESLKLVRANLKSRNLAADLASNFTIVSPDPKKLDYPDNHFDLIYSNQVLYYFPTEERIDALCKEFARILKPNGVVFFTMMGPKNYYVTHHLKQVHNERVFEVAINDPKHRLNGMHEMIFIVRDEEDLKHIFRQFAPLSTGYFDQSMFDLKSNFHWIFVGKKR